MVKNNKTKAFLSSNLFFIVLLSFFSIFFSLLKLNKGYTFEWDQADDASKVFSIISQKKPLLIGPRVSNDNGFFVGPYHYYFLLPFYLITKGDPVAGNYAVIFINALTVLISFFIVRKVSNQKIAILSSFLLSIFLGKICWNAMYAPLIAILTFYICYQAIKGQFSFSLAMLFAGFISNIHLVPASLVPIIIFSFFLSSKKPTIKQIFLGIFLFCLPFIPIVIFDLRHDFLNLNKLFLMFFGNKNIQTESFIKYLWLRSFWRSLNIFGFFPVMVERLVFLFVLISSPFLFKGSKNKTLIAIWILFPLLLLSRYKGAISEYYYTIVISLLPFFISIIILKFIKNYKILFCLVFAFFVFSIYKIDKQSSPVTLNDKKAIVNYLINQKNDQPFNLSYETGLGLDFGFEYLFIYSGNTPKNINNAHLYTLFVDNNVPKNSNVVFKQNIYSLIRR